MFCCPNCNSVHDDAIEVRVDGVPVPQPRPRRSRHGGVYNPADARGWKLVIALAAARLAPRRTPTCALGMSLQIDLPRGRYTMLHPTAGADADNLAKPVMDALQQVGMFRNDAQIVDLGIRKRFAADRPGATIRIWPVGVNR